MLDSGKGRNGITNDRLVSHRPGLLIRKPGFAFDLVVIPSLSAPDSLLGRVGSIIQHTLRTLNDYTPKPVTFSENLESVGI